MACLLYRKDENGNIVEERIPATDVEFNLSTGIYANSPEGLEKPKAKTKPKAKAKAE